MSYLLEEITSGKWTEMVICASPGSGKTTLIEVLVPYVVALDPGPMLVVGQDDKNAADWAETRLSPVLDACEPVRKLMPKDRFKRKKTEIFFPHMPVFVAGANMSSLQEKSIQWAFADEVWQWKQGRMNELRARHHDRWNRRSIFVSQGSDEGHDFHASWLRGTQSVLGFTCPVCGEWQAYSWGQVKIPSEEDGSFKPLDEVEKGCIYQCKHCEAQFNDTPTSRRALAQSQSVRHENPNALAGILSVRIPALAVWWIPWGTLAVEWVKANEAKRRGDMEPLKQFIQKRLAQFWKEEESAPWGALTGAGYTMAEYADGQLWPGERYRFLTFDVQRDHFWYAVRAWKVDGQSRLLACGKALTWETMRSIQEQFNVNDALTFPDAQYETGQVYDWCSRFGWTAIHGSGRDGFRHIQRNKKPVTKFYSPLQQVSAPSGGQCRYAFWASDPVKDTLAALRQGDSEHWQTPDDVSEDYAHQIDAEMKKEVVNKKTKAVEFRWVRIRQHNHLWDCEAMQVAAAMMMGVLRGGASD